MFKAYNFSIIMTKGIKMAWTIASHDGSSSLNKQKLRKSTVDKSDLLDTFGPSESLCEISFGLKQPTSPIVKIFKNKTLCQVNPVTKFYLFLRMLSHLMIYHDIVRSGDCYKICLGGSLSRNKGCKSFFLCGDNNQWLLCCHDGKACKKIYLCINVSMYVRVGV